MHLYISRNTVIGIIVILLSVWIYSAMSSFKIEKGTTPERLVIREGAERTENEVAQKLADEMGFDLEGAYKTGYAPRHVIEYLIAEPHDFDVTFYNNRFYEGRITILRLIPQLFCIFLGIIGVGLIIPRKKLRKSRTQHETGK
jgi:hypothetical protein